MSWVTRQHKALPETQRGAVVLLLLLILTVSTASYFLVKRLNSRNIDIKRDKITAAALAQAKAALIGRAASDPNRPGEIPCPDVDNDGQSAFSTTCTYLAGRLPWFTLRLPDLRDGYGERLWYALANDFHATGDSPPLNTATTGRLSIIGTPTANDVIAIVFSSGPALGNQSRDSTNANSVMNYLEGENVNGDSVYEANNSSGTFNDKLLTITYNDLFSAVTRRVASEIGIQIASHFSGTLPGDLSFIPHENWLYKQEWTDITITSPITTYTQISTTKATLLFRNCPGLTYTIEIVNNSSKTTVNGQSC